MVSYHILNGCPYINGVFCESSDIHVENGIIADIQPQGYGKYRGEIFDATNCSIIPGFIDIHVHGMHGFDTSDAAVDSILGIAKGVARTGVTRFCPTLYTQSEDKMLKCIEVIATAKVQERQGQNPGAIIDGIHLEGPFISPHKAGAQPLGDIRKNLKKEVDLVFLDRAYEAAKGNISIITAAPELEGIEVLSTFCRSHDIVLSAGHTNASYEEALSGLKQGFCGATHLFNAMPPMTSRNPGCVGLFLENDNAYCEFIGDGKHLHPGIVRQIIKVKPADKSVLVTDCLAPAGLETGPLIANSRPVYLKDGLFHHEDDDRIAGSSLTMAQGFKNLLSWGVDISQAVQCASLNPALVLQQRNEIKVGQKAGFVVLDQSMNPLRAAIGSNFINTRR
ncbi:MAG: N-acetylglucosamine-6-phosphate deacetylase [Desulfuromonadaceae bacterium]|nr:N-acetylglucosamine-6-phosphate deacetylase [Desulfuromonas sp.]MDY0185120.1 N-acetylglucosamine-6-phosphate deacetylase [Desulfuromonadaceae bacterium]